MVRHFKEHVYVRRKKHSADKTEEEAQHGLMERLSVTSRRDMPISPDYADEVRRKAILGYFKW